MQRMNGQLQEFLQVAEDAARAGGQILLRYRYEPLEIAHKERQEVVTNVDRLADETIYNVLSHYFPNHTVISEESGRRGPTSPYTWIIDPLDGTESYIRGQNFSGVTIALTKEGELVLGVVCHPFQDELYTATSGGETMVNGHPVRVSEIASLDQARLILDYSPRDELRRHLHTLEWERGFRQAFRIGGSVALNMCLVARGAVEGYLYARMRNRVQSWDTAAATLIVQHAGGRVLDRQGQPVDTNQPQGFVWCCNGVLDMQRLFKGDLLTATSPVATHNTTS
jgi:myo-inositol-1(or 4)-monophosphatase